MIFISGHNRFFNREPNYVSLQRARIIRRGRHCSLDVTARSARDFKAKLRNDVLYCEPVRLERNTVELL